MDRGNTMRQMLSKLPLEDQVDKLLDSIGQAINESGVMKKLEELQGKAPSVPSRTVPTPLGDVEIPEIALPKIQVPTLDERKKAAIKAALGIDLTFGIALIPLVGDIVADVVEDIYMDKIRSLLTPEELALFMRYDKVGPSVVAMLRTWGKEGVGWVR